MITLDWIGGVMFENKQMMTCAKVTPQGKIIGYYFKCLIHGMRVDTDQFHAALVNYPALFCPDCRQGLPRSDWDAPSSFAQSFIDAFATGMQPRKVEVDTSNAIGFEIIPPEKPRQN